MYRSTRLRPVSRRRLAWLVALLLLWQQVAVAAYACTMTSDAMTMAMTASATADTMSMEGTCPSMHGAPDRAVCQAHCHPDHAAQPDARPGSVPPSLLAALPAYFPAPTLVLAMPSRAPERLVRLRAPPPPATLLYCSLLI